MMDFDKMLSLTEYEELGKKYEGSFNDFFNYKTVSQNVLEHVVNLTNLREKIKLNNTASLLLTFHNSWLTKQDSSPLTEETLINFTANCCFALLGLQKFLETAFIKDENEKVKDYPWLLRFSKQKGLMLPPSRPSIPDLDNHVYSHSRNSYEGRSLISDCSWSNLIVFMRCYPVVETDIEFIVPFDKVNISDWRQSIITVNIKHVGDDYKIPLGQLRSRLNEIVTNRRIRSYGFY